MTTGLLITTAGQAAIAADLAGGADLVLSHVAFGDAGGVPYLPNEAQVALVNERYRATIASVAVIAGAIVVDAVIPADTPDGSARPSHGFSVAEAGIYSAAGTLVGVARMGNGYKPPPSTGQASIATFRFKLAVANPSAITVVIDPLAQVNVGRQVRPFFLAVDGLLNAPPGAPAVGATYAIGAAPTGAWAGFANRLAQWVGVWALSAVPLGHQVVNNAVGVDAGGRWLEMTGAGWVPSLGRLLQKQPGSYAVGGGTANAITVTLDPVPANFAALTGAPIRVKIAFTNTSEDVTFDFGTGAVDVIKPGGGKPAVGELAQGMIAEFVPDGTAVQLVSVGAVIAAPAALRFRWSEDTPGTYTVTIPDNVFWLLLRGQGAGGGGAKDTGSGATGGGAGGYGEAIRRVVPGQTLTVFIPQGGLGSTGAGGNPGQTLTITGFLFDQDDLSISGGGGGSPDGVSGGSGGAPAGWELLSLIGGGGGGPYFVSGSRIGGFGGGGFSGFATPGSGAGQSNNPSGSGGAGGTNGGDGQSGNNGWLTMEAI